VVLKKHGCSTAALSSYVANHSLHDSGLNANQLFHIICDSEFDPTRAVSSLPPPATTAATAVTHHWLQALDSGYGEKSDLGHPFKRFLALSVARQHFVQAHAAQGLAGLLQTCSATVSALQELLPFVRAPHQLITQQPSLNKHLQEPQQQQQQQQQHQDTQFLRSRSNSSRASTAASIFSNGARSAPFLQAPDCSSSTSSSYSNQQLEEGTERLPSLLELLPPAQQAWLLGDVVAGLLLSQPADAASISSSATGTMSSSRSR
jgi:hypothetical protein